ncbi:MAG: YciI family protein [Myxococcota bacterium]|nr:YciI family protein [Myxococcota bacterium]
MFIALVAHDRPDSGTLRGEVREAHLAYLRESGVVRQAGPLLDETGGMCGSLLILELPDIAAAERWAEADPYARAGLFDSVQLLRWQKVI